MRDRGYSNYKRNYSSKKTQPDDDLKYGGPVNSGFEKSEGPTNMEYQRKAFRDLVYGYVTWKVNPNEEVSQQAQPYAILNSTNPIVDAKYPGQDNTSGNVIQQLANGSQSTFVNMPDMITQRLDVNYLFANYNLNSNADSRVNSLLEVPWNDILSTVSAEAFYDLPFFKWTVDGTSQFSDKLLDLVLNYQIAIQATTMVGLRFKVIRSLEKHLKDMSYLSCSSVVNNIYGYLKKAAFVNIMKGLTNVTASHFTDTYWFKQVSTLMAIPCRKTNSMTDPLMDLIPAFSYNDGLTVYADAAKTTKLFDSTIVKSIVDACETIIEEISPENIMKMARTNASADSIRQWFNKVSNDTQSVVTLMDTFTNNFKDLVVAFKRMAKVGMTDWELGMFMDLDRLEGEFEPQFNKLVFDIIRSSKTGSSEIEYDGRINKWNYLVLWDQYLGIPTYDMLSGGSILTFSNHEINRTEAPSSVTYPAMYNPGNCTILTREGTILNIDIVSETIATNKILARLSPVTSMDGNEYFIPYVDATSLVVDAKTQAWLGRLLVRVYGYGKILVATGVNNYVINDDVVTFIDVNIDDQRNAIETYSRQHAPFRVLKQTYTEMLGFTTKTGN